MTRSLWIGGIALLLLFGGSIAGYFMLQRRLAPLQAEASMPQNPLLVLRMPNPYAWPAQGMVDPQDAAQGSVPAWESTPLMQGLRAACAAWGNGADSASGEKPGDALWASAYIGGGGRIDWLLIRRETETRSFPWSTAAPEPAADQAAGAERFEGVDLYALDGDRWSFRHRGLRVVAANRALAEDAVRCALGKTTPLNDPVFERLSARTGKHRETTVYWNMASLADYLGLFADARFGRDLEALGRMSRWMSSDLKRMDGLLFASGYATDWFAAAGDAPEEANGGDGPRASTAAAALASRFPVAGAADWRIDEVFPARTRAFWRVSAGPEGQGLFRPGYAQAVGGLDDPWHRMLGPEWAVGLVDPSSGDPQRHALMAIRVSEPQTLDETLAPLSIADGVFEGQTAERAIRKLDPASGDGLPAISMRFGRSLTAFDAAWFARVDDFLLLSPDRRQLEQALDGCERGAVLRANLEFAAFRERLLPGANATLYLDLPALAPLAEGLALPRYQEALAKRLGQHANLRPLVLQWDRYRSEFLASGFLGNGAAFASGAAAGAADAGNLWSLRLDTVLASKPRFVVDHRDGRGELLLEDAAHQLYLVDASGRILWKRPLDGPILGEIHQVDYYRNAKLQYAFATPGRIHMIDRKGRDVADFPIALTAGASTGLQVFDYEDKRDYRLFVGGDNGFLYGYYKTGKPLPGWSPMKGLNGMRHPPQHTAYNGKDYIAFSGLNGKVFLKDRQGTDRTSPKAIGAPLLDPWTVMPENGEPVLLACDTLGTVYRLHLDGSMDRRSSPRVNGRSRFAAANLDAQGNSEWISLTDQAVLARNADGTARWQWDLPDPGPHGWSVSGNGPRMLFAVWSPVSGEWVCLNASGQPLSGFPTQGGGPCAIGALNGEGSSVFVGAVGSVVEARNLP